MTTIATATHAEASHAARDTIGEAARGWYLYGITRLAPLAVALAEADAVPERSDYTAQHAHADPLQLLECSGLAAVVRSVLLANFSAAVLQERLRNASELEALVRSHNHVTAAVHRQQAILPAKFGSVYASAGDVMAALQPVHDTLLRQLDRLEGRDEWAIHIYADDAVLRRHVAATDPDILRLRERCSTANRGRAYFLERQLRDELEAATQDALTARARQAYDRLAEVAVASEVHPFVPAADAAHEVEILRAAFLVAREDADLFEGTLRSAESPDEGVRCEWSGPWPPYSFAVRDEEPV